MLLHAPFDRQYGNALLTFSRYDAIRKWNACLKNPDSEFWTQLAPGTAVVVDNHRVLHGRSAFTGKRRMCGAYLGRDDYHARLQALRGLFAGYEGPGGVWGPLL